VGIVFGVVQKSSIGFSISEPYRVRLVQQKEGRWVMRRISSAIFAARKGKTENFLVRGVTHQRKGFKTPLALENTKNSIQACRVIDKLFAARSEIKKVIVSMNVAYFNIKRSHPTLKKKCADTLVAYGKNLEVDFSNPTVAYKIIKQKINSR
jgi:hypothetical protein